MVNKEIAGKLPYSNKVSLGECRNLVFTFQSAIILPFSQSVKILQENICWLNYIKSIEIKNKLVSEILKEECKKASLNYKVE